MLGDEELIFSGKYKDFAFGQRFDLSSATPKDAASALLHISNNIEQAGYRFSGIAYEKIDKLAKKLNTPSEVAQYLSESSTKKALDDCAKDKKLLPAAESCFLNLLLSRAGIDTKPNIPLSLKGENYEEKGRMVFVAKYREWVVIKKLSLEDLEGDWEISGIIASANMSALNKAFQLASEDYEGKLAEAKKIASGKRKSLAAAGEIINKTANDPIILTKALEELGYYTYLTPFVLMEAYPDLKPKKPKGRVPKG